LFLPFAASASDDGQEGQAHGEKGALLTLENTLFITFLMRTVFTFGVMKQMAFIQ